jgi:hypothetical protein
MPPVCSRSGAATESALGRRHAAGIWSLRLGVRRHAERLSRWERHNAQGDAIEKQGPTPREPRISRLAPSRRRGAAIQLGASPGRPSTTHCDGML